jgi:hypothetical protein
MIEPLSDPAPIVSATPCRCGSCGAPLVRERCDYCGTRHAVERERPVMAHMGRWAWATPASVCYDEDYFTGADAQAGMSAVDGMPMSTDPS